MKAVSSSPNISLKETPATMTEVNAGMNIMDLKKDLAFISVEFNNTANIIGTGINTNTVMAAYMVLVFSAL